MSSAETLCAFKIGGPAPFLVPTVAAITLAARGVSIRLNSEFASLALALYRQQFDLKKEGGVGTNVGARAALAIRKGGRKKALPLPSPWHQLEGLGPAFDDSTSRKCRRLAALVGAVKFLAVD